jgi:cytidylate kinase
VVTIDGPAGAGKSSVTRRVAAELGYTVVDTGALYRAVALAAKRARVDWGDQAEVVALARGLAAREAIAFGPLAEGRTQVFLDSEDVSLAVRDEDISQGASIVSAIAGVRDALLEVQRALGKEGGVVLEGRDTGTVIFPQARAKFFLTAGVNIRAERRFNELRARGEAVELSTVLNEVIERDKRDTLRPVAPLKPASDASLVDSSDKTLEQVVAEIVARVRNIEAALAEPAADS